MATENFTTPGGPFSWSVPYGIDGNVLIVCIGGGAGGLSSGYGGGGGAYSTWAVALTAGDAYDVLVGAGGAADANGDSSGLQIPTSTFAVLAQGGQGATGGSGGAMGNTVYPGGDGGAPDGVGEAAGGGGSSGGSSADGADGSPGSDITGGAGGTAPAGGGDGGRGQDADGSNGANGVTPGGGGGGKKLGAGGAAQSGAAGKVAISYTYKVPTVTDCEPAAGSSDGGDSVTLTGTHFFAGFVPKFGGAAATNVVIVNETTITCNTPAHAAGQVDVTVENPDAVAGTLGNGFEFVDPPTVDAIDPSTGSTAGGTAVTITGTGFVDGATVTIGGQAATSVVVVDPTEITCDTPAHAAGTVDVVVTNSDTQSDTLVDGFEYVAPEDSTAARSSVRVGIGMGL